jgi:zinc transporter
MSAVAQTGKFAHVAPMPHVSVRSARSKFEVRSSKLGASRGRERRAIWIGSDGTALRIRFAADEAGQPIDVDTASAVLAALDGTGAPAGRFFWLHFNLANQASQRWLRQHLALPDDFHALLEPSRSTRVEVAGDAVVAVINDATLFGVDTTDISTMAVYVTDGLLVSARRTPLRSADRLREEVKAGERFASPIDLLAHFLRHQADMLRDTAASTAARVDVIEDHVMANDVSGQRAGLGALVVFRRFRR